MNHSRWYLGTFPSDAGVDLKGWSYLFKLFNTIFFIHFSTSIKQNDALIKEINIHHRLQHSETGIKGKYSLTIKKSVTHENLLGIF